MLLFANFYEKIKLTTKRFVRCSMELFDYEIKHNSYLRENGAECTLLLKRDGNFPLKETGKIALFGNGARHTIKGGTGSGEVNSRFFVNIEDGLKNSGFEITSGAWLDKYDVILDKAHKEFIEALKIKMAEENTFTMGVIMSEPEYSIPLDGEGDTAIYVLSRISGEGSDRSVVKGEVLLTDTEVRDILELNSRYKNFMLVLNVGGVVDLTPVKDVGNILLFSQLGVMSGDIFADIILGKSNPSGKLTTTWSTWEDYPEIIEIGDLNDTCYKEGIYVGYRYFDTVGKLPMYPFGFGLSYTDFEITASDFDVNGDLITVTCEVKNIGSYAGKEVVQVYVSIPSGKLDQPYQVLSGFAKSPCINPGASSKVTVKFNLSDIASYSSADTAYILEAGKYAIRVGNSSISTSCIGSVVLDSEIIITKVRSVTKAPSFEDFNPGISCDTDLESANLKSITIPSDAFTTRVVEYDKAPSIDSRVASLPEDDLIGMCLGQYGHSELPETVIGTQGFSVAGAAGQTYMFASQYGIPSIVMADGPAGVRLNRRAAIDSKGIVHPLENGLPETMLELLPEDQKPDLYQPKDGDKIIEQYATALPIGTAIAQSFNVDFAFACGDMVGVEMSRFGVHLWLAPALNIHRSILCGRNFEYYSEDPLVSGLITSGITRGVQKHPGCAVTIKHFCCNNQEYNRIQNNSVVSERALREIYLRGFEIAIRESSPKAIMTSYNLLNGVHTNESAPLHKDILRSEFGFTNLIMTDWVMNGWGAFEGCIHPEALAHNVIKAGCDVFMPGSEFDFNNVKNALSSGYLTRSDLEASASSVARIADELFGKFEG